MPPNRRRILALMAAAGTGSLAGCSGGDGGDEDDGSSGDSDGGDGTTGENDGSDTGGDGGDSGGDDGGTTDDGSEDDAGGTGTDGDDGSDGSDGSDDAVQPGDIRGTVESSVDELEVVGHEVMGVNPQVKVDVELRNAGGEENVALTHHNFAVGLFDTDGNPILRDHGTRGPDESPAPGETGVVEVFLYPEPETTPASYEITVNCDAEATMFNYCESE